MSSSARRPRIRSDAHQPLSSSIRDLPGVGKKREELLRSLGIETVGDLLVYPPTRYIDRKSFSRIADLREGEIQTVVARALKFEIKPVRGKRICIAHVEDASGKMRCVWFNQPFLRNVFKPGTTLVFSGAVHLDKHGPTMVHPEYEDAASERLHTGRIVPVYRARPGLSQKQLRVLVKAALDTHARDVADYVPEAVRRELQLVALREAIGNLHFPSDLSEAERARRRMAFDEMLLFQTVFALARKEKGYAGRVEDGARIGRRDDRATRGARAAEKFMSHLPFRLTPAQTQAHDDIVADLTRPYPMRRLLQGDVGCGKTVVASLGAALVCQSGGQVALLCPTEILAEQHFETVRKYLAPFSFPVGLLTGGMPSDERQRATDAVASGETQVIVGTHALIGERIRFKDLRLVIVDEEQRFGVLQRTKLVRDTPHANLLVVSATPIPRTLALTAYGDLDITVIGEMPPGRGRHTTKVINAEAKPGVLREVAAWINAGLRGFYVCPALEESSIDLVDVGAAKARIEGLLKPGRGAEILTGRTARDKRAKILKDFLSDKIGLIVATTVVEVGMDIPSATILIVEQAERFGLSQLHQMRGRVARTDAESFSYFMVSEGASEKARARLSVLESTFDGFEIAEKDLMLRGPGDLVGTRQHGIPDLRFASLPEDMDLMLRARDEAFKSVLGQGASAEWHVWIDAVRSLTEGKISIV